MKAKYIGTQLNKFNHIFDFSKSNKLSEGFIMQLYNVLNKIETVQRKNVWFHFFLIKFFLEMQNEIIIEASKKRAPIGNAAGRKNTPVRNRVLPIFK